MSSYVLQPNEVLLMKDVGVSHGGVFATFSDELILTNLNLVLVEKGILGQTKNVMVFPLSQVKVHDGHAQAVLGRTRNLTPVLDVYFLTGQESFGFAGGQPKVLAWVAAIDEAITGRRVVAAADAPTAALPGTEIVADALRGTIGMLKGALSGRPTPPPPPAPVVVGGTCHACGAPISATAGHPPTCDYCDTVQRPGNR